MFLTILEIHAELNISCTYTMAMLFYAHTADSYAYKFALIRPIVRPNNLTHAYLQKEKSESHFILTG